MAGDPAAAATASSQDWPSLTSDQQRLLLQALSSNDRRLNMDTFRSFQDEASGNDLSATDGVDPHVFQNASSSPSVRSQRPVTFGNGFLPHMSNGNSTDFNVELPQDLIDGLSTFGNGESGEKRKSSEDDDLDDDEAGEAKRHENGDKLPKKPGRKPLVAEPTTKRKAQNRAAQRAFRERKEQHLKDLENKINHLTQASLSRNHENSILRAQVVRLQDEMLSYKKRLSVGATVGSGSPTNNSFGSYRETIETPNNPFDFTFQGSAQFDNLTGISPRNDRSSGKPHSPDAGFIGVKRESSSRSNSNSNGWSPESALNDFSSLSSQSPSNNVRPNDDQSAASANILTPKFFDVGSNSYGFPQFGSPSPLLNNQTATADQDKALPNGDSRGSSGSISSHAPSPSASSSWRNGASSSCGTSPEPWNDLSGEKSGGSQNTQSGTTQLGNLADFQFDPTLFGGYRESQDAIFGDGDFSGGLYDDFLNMPDGEEEDFDNTHVPTAQKTATPAPTKSTLMDEVARQREGVMDEEHHIPVDESLLPEDGGGRQMMTCHTIWQELQHCPKFQQGDLDIDGLCSELSKKAVCTESGANIPKDEWEAALWRLVGQPDGNKSGTT